MSNQTTYLISAADSTLIYSLILNLNARPNTTIIALTNISSETWTWRLLSAAPKATNSQIQPLHLSPTLSVSTAADIVAKEWGMTVDVLVSGVESVTDPRVLVSGFETCLVPGAKVVVLRKEVESWCRDFVAQLRERGFVARAVAVGEVGERDVLEKAQWILKTVDRVEKEKGKKVVGR